MQVKFSGLFRLAALAFWITLFGTGLSISGQNASAERAQIFEEVWNTINEKYYDARFNGVDWRSVGETYRARLTKVSSDQDFYALLDEMAGQLRDSHTRVYSPQQREERRNQRRSGVGISIRENGTRLVITEVAPGSEAEKIGIKAGMIVVSVNGRPIREVLRQAQKAVGVSSSRRATRMRVFSKILAGELDSKLNIELKIAAGKSRKFTLTRLAASALPQIEGKILPSRIAYLKFSQFDESIEKQIEEFLVNFKDAPALILDLRGNRGGDGEMGLRFAGRFFKDKVTVARIVTRTGKPPVAGMPLILETAPARQQIFSRPVVILINAETASTAELVANAFREQKRARIFGTNSCGCVLAFLGYRPIGGGGDLTLSEFGFLTPRGRKLEGEGVAPDRIISPTIRDLQKGRDRALEEAIKYLVKMIRRAKQKAALCGKLKSNLNRKRQN